MFKLTALAFTAMLVAPPVPDAGSTYLDALLAQRAAIPIVSATTVDGGVLAMHSDWSGTYVRPFEFGYCVSLADVLVDRDDQQIGGQVPTVRTSWTDKDGMQHEVTTPVASASKSGIERAMETHRSLVSAMQAVWPPHKAPPP